MTVNRIFSLTALSVALLTCATVALAQQRRPPEEGGLTYSMKRPRSIHGQFGASAGARFYGDRQVGFVSYLNVAAYKDLAHPAYTTMGPWAEAYGGFTDGRFDGGGRAYLMVPAFKFGTGADYNIRDDHFDFILTFLLPVRRGGIVGHGSQLRIDYVPGRDHLLTFGLEWPFQKYAGKTRPAKDHVRFRKTKAKRITAEPSAEIKHALKNIGDVSFWVNRLTMPYLDDNGFTDGQARSKFQKRLHEIRTYMASTDDWFPEGHTHGAVVNFYHDELDRLFSMAAGDTALSMFESTAMGREVAGEARRLLLDEVIIRYDRLLGQRKKNDTILSYGPNARGLFARWLITESSVPDANHTMVLYAFQEIVKTIEGIRKINRKEFDRSRVVWIPMQFALRPEDHDTQEEIDSIVERVTNAKFTTGNFFWYVINSQFQWELNTQILAAEDYHVLWIHDFIGTNHEGDPDRVSYAQVVYSYLKAMTQRVRDYDEKGTFPVYIIIQDQFYYENNESSRWYGVLGDPLGAKIELPKDFQWMETSIDSAQAELRNAVAESDLLQAEAQQFGQEWLHNRISVHINITNPADASFWSNYMLPIVGMHDNYTRDHRKISFYDVTETGPRKGKAVFTGMGIGEHYTDGRWEDRGVLAEGPVLLDLKHAAYDLLTRQGVDPDDIPHVLRPRPKPAYYEDLVASMRAEGDSLEALQLHNVIGFGPKPISAFKATAYTLMPKGSVQIMPDFVWQNPVWASMCIGSALRGVDNIFIHPSIPNEPNPAAFPQARTREMFVRVITARDSLASQITAAGGALHTGFYNPDMDVNDLSTRLKTVAQRRDQYPFIYDYFSTGGNPERTVAAIDSMLDAIGYEMPPEVDQKDKRLPQLHMKTHLFVSGEAWQIARSAKNWDKGLLVYMAERAKQLQSTEYYDPRNLANALREVMSPPLIESLAATPEDVRDKAVLYLTVGSQNQDYRGMFLDGEVYFIAPRWAALYAVLDYMFLTGLCDWVDTIEEMEVHVGTYGWLQRHLSRFATPMM